LTDIDAEVAGDAVLAPIDESQWTEVRRQAYPASDDVEYPFAIRVLERR
ncbi:MAG: Dihydrofolate reductase, partial [Phenylobacterium sp.]|nr:Dihydrofolate reductase [Phenylobacterium sp.]